jgi:hypothetical protein
MSPRRPDPFKPDPDAAFSKRQVNRSGQLILAMWESDVSNDELWSHSTSTRSFARIRL